uniref:ShKT domain-containing protein n=1 Tax=Syphacia muris TaxID=451379 RepID=A0A0N5AMB4_9BILA
MRHCLPVAVLFTLLLFDSLFKESFSSEFCKPEKPPETCQDKIPSCSNALGSINNCNNSEYANIFPLCPRFCKQCCNLPQYQCADDPAPCMKCKDLVDPNTHQCSTKLPVYQHVALKYCPMTCGMCNGDPVCADRDEEKCREIKESGYCEDPEFQDAAIQDCPVSCSACDELKCEDKSKGCSAFVSLCKDPSREEFLKKNCKKTCNFCQPLQLECKDAKTM